MIGYLERNERIQGPLTTHSSVGRGTGVGTVQLQSTAQVEARKSNHRVIVAMSNELWFRGMDIKEEGERRNISKDTRAHLEAMVLRTKPEANQWLHITPRVAAVGADAFEQGPVMIRKIHAYLVKEVNLAENTEEKAAEFVNRVCQVTLETFWTQKVKGEEGFERTDSMLEGLGAGWTESFLAKVYPKLSRYLIKEFLQAVVEVSIVELLALFVTFGAENFVNGPVVLLTEGVQNLQLDGFLTLIAITHGNLGGLMNLTRSLPGADERECEEIRCEESHGFVE